MDFKEVGCEDVDWI